MIPALKITAKRVYGTLYFYPECDISKAIVKVKGGKTLSRENIQALRSAGFTMHITDEDGDLMEYGPIAV